MGFFDWLKRKAAQPATSSSNSLVEDARKMADWISRALNSSGYRADFSLDSLREVDRFFDEHSKDGNPTSGGLLSEQLGQRLFALGAYVGECVIRNYGGEWKGDDDDPEGEINIQVNLPAGSTIWPVMRVMKRLKNGTEDALYVYGQFVGKPPEASDI